MQNERDQYLNDVRALRASSRFSYTAGSGRVYILMKPTEISLLASGVADSAWATLETKEGESVNDVKARVTDNPETLSQMSRILPGILARHIVKPKIFLGHPADCPDDSVTIGELPDGDPMELLKVLMPSYISEGGRAEMEAVGKFREGPERYAVSGDVQGLSPEPGADPAGG